MMRDKSLGIVSIQYELPYILYSNDIKVCVHKVDWTINYNDRVEVVEFKGVNETEPSHSAYLTFQVFTHDRAEDEKTLVLCGCYYPEVDQAYVFDSHSEQYVLAERHPQLASGEVEPKQGAGHDRPCQPETPAATT